MRSATHGDHMAGIKYYIKNIIFAVCLIAVLIGIGVVMIGDIVHMELQKSTYTRTLFDFHIAAPDTKQVQALEENESVECVFPYYAYANAFSKNDEVMLLLSDDMDDSYASLLTDGTLIDGAYNKDGAMLDKTAADALGVGVGDTVRFTLLGTKITKTVSAIYLPSSLAIMEKGIVLAAYSEEQAQIKLPAAYGGAFVIAADRDATAELLSDYVGNGNIALTFEQYTDLYCGTVLPNETQEEYEAKCIEKYTAYREEVLSSAKKDGGQVIDKTEAYDLLSEKILTTEKRLKSRMLLTMITAFAVFAGFGILFTVSNRANDRIRRDAGVGAKKTVACYMGGMVLIAVAVMGIVGGVLCAVAFGTYFVRECLAAVLLLILPIAFALLPFAIALLLYIRQLYAHSVSKNEP